MRLITLCFIGLPVSLKNCLATFHARLDGLAAAGGEEDPVEVAGREVGEPLGQLDRLRVRVGPQREERELLGLLGGSLGQLGAAVPGLHDEQPGQPVEVALALVVPDVGTLTSRDDGDVGLGVRRHPGEVHPEVVARRAGHGAGRVDVRLLGAVLRGQGHLVPQL